MTYSFLRGVWVKTVGFPHRAFGRNVRGGKRIVVLPKNSRNLSAPEKKIYNIFSSLNRVGFYLQTGLTKDKIAGRGKRSLSADYRQKVI
jgi:hypothetical protein